MRRKRLISVAMYSCTGCNLHKDSWPRKQVGAKIQSMQCFIHPCALTWNSVDPGEGGTFL